MAVVLMERHAYGESLETLIDGCSLMESALRHQHLPTPDSSSDLLVADKIHKACARLSTSLASSSTASGALPSAADSVVVVVVVNHDGTCLESPTSIDSTLGALKHNPCSASPIRLEAVDYQRLEERNPELESGMMIFNLGVAYLCLSRAACRSRSASFKLRAVSVRIFRMAYDAIAKQLLAEAQQEVQENQIRLATRLLLLHIILKHTVQAHLDNGELVEAMEAQKQLERLAKTIDEIGVSGSATEIASTTNCPAPAA